MPDDVEIEVPDDQPEPPYVDDLDEDGTDDGPEPMQAGKVLSDE